MARHAHGAPASRVGGGRRGEWGQTADGVPALLPPVSQPSPFPFIDRHACLPRRPWCAEGHAGGAGEQRSGRRRAPPIGAALARSRRRRCGRAMRKRMGAVGGVEWRATEGWRGRRPAHPRQQLSSSSPPLPWPRTSSRRPSPRPRSRRPRPSPRRRPRRPSLPRRRRPRRRRSRQPRPRRRKSRRRCPRRRRSRRRSRRRRCPLVRGGEAAAVAARRSGDPVPTRFPPPSTHSHALAHTLVQRRQRLVSSSFPPAAFRRRSGGHPCFHRDRSLRRRDRGHHHRRRRRRGGHRGRRHVRDAAARGRGGGRREGLRAERRAAAFLPAPLKPRNGTHTIMPQPRDRLPRTGRACRPPASARPFRPRVRHPFPDSPGLAGAAPWTPSACLRMRRRASGGGGGGVERAATTTTPRLPRRSLSLSRRCRPLPCQRAPRRLAAPPPPAGPRPPLHHGRHAQAPGGDRPHAQAGDRGPGSV